MKSLKTQNGFTLVRFLIVLAATTITIPVVILSIISVQYRTPFQKYFGMDPEKENFVFDAQVRATAQPVISRKLQELAIDVGKSKEEVRKLSDRYSAATPGDKPECLKALRAALVAHEATREDYRTARRVAVWYRFKVG